MSVYYVWCVLHVAVLQAHEAYTVFCVYTVRTVCMYNTLSLCNASIFVLIYKCHLVFIRSHQRTHQGS